MENRDLIIPARFDSKDVLSGLKAVDESGRAAGDLGQTADAASARFRKAHESVESALQEFNLLRRALQRSPGDGDSPLVGDSAPDEAGRGDGAKSPPEVWLGLPDGLRGAAMARLGGSVMGQADETAGGLRPVEVSALTTGESPPRTVVNPAAPPLEYDPRPNPGGTDSPGAGVLPMSGVGRSEGPTTLDPPGAFFPGRFTGSQGNLGPSGAMTAADRHEPTRRDGPIGEAKTGDLGPYLEDSDVLAALRWRQGLTKGPNGEGSEPAVSGGMRSMAPEALADFAGWAAGTGDGRRMPPEATRSTGVTADAAGVGLRGLQSSRGEAEDSHSGGRHSEGSDPREEIWRIRPPSLLVPPAPDSLAEGWTMRSGQGRAGSSPGDGDVGARLGAASTTVIERLLREQNELIRQDLQRGANPPIAAPPPLRGGGIRM